MTPTIKIDSVFLIPFTILVITGFLDAIETILFLQRGIAEANPIINFFIKDRSLSFAAFVIVSLKIATFLFLVLGLSIHSRQEHSKEGRIIIASLAWFVSCVYIYVVILSADAIAMSYYCTTILTDYLYIITAFFSF